MLGTAAVVALGYYVGVQVGVALRFPPATTSVLWPPNAILTAALLLTPVRRWWVCLAAALPVHFLVQSSLGWSTPFVAALFATNCSEALIGAGFIRAYSDAPTRFDTLRRVAIFIVGAGLLAPLVSSFADAAVVRAFQGEPFWVVWRTRLFANSLTELSVVPLVVLAATRGIAYLSELTRRKLLETLLLGCVLVAVAVLTFGAGTVGFDLPGVPSTPTVFVLPLFFWAALRFGAGGVSAALLVIALTASFAARMGSRPFDVLAPAESLLALQIYLIVMGIPLLALSALVDERRRAMAELAERLRFEELLSQLSRAFVRSPSDRIGEAFEVCLQRTGKFFGVDRAAIMQLSPTGEHLLVFRQWRAERVEPLQDAYSRDMFPWAAGRLLRGAEVVCESADDLPRDAERDRGSFTELGLRAAVAVPLVTSDTVQGVLSVQMLRGPRAWPESILAQLRMVAEVLANALGRCRADEALRSSESMKTAILASLSSRVAVLDKDGVIIAVNEKWLSPTENEAASLAAVDVGTDYLEVCRRAEAEGDRSAADALAGVQSVLWGRAQSFMLEYRDWENEGHWHTMAVTPLQRADGGVVVSHEDVTKRKLAELDAQRARQDLAHFTRVSTMGELTASLAHQLNQPLTGILSNAQAARRMLDASYPDLVEVREIVRDIIEDDRRAGEVIRRLRDMMTKGSSDMVVTDANALIRDVAMLTSSDAVIRNVSLTLELDDRLRQVRGDPIELQQVMLNLLVNAIDAVAGRPVPERSVVVRSEHADDDSVLVTVKDSGDGLLPGSESTVFEPFFTTKADGMGMGLAIARSIVESHGGQIWAANNEGCGATFFVRLPLAQALVTL